ncbi:MAG: WD40/YVTN/BNR-like repeat-containing protein [Aquincola tertiaricarbonis]
MRLHLFLPALLLACCLTGLQAQPSPATPPQPQPQPALRVPHAAQAAVLGAARAGQRIVTVGDHGVVMLSDDGGRQWRQAREVPVRSLLAAVSFADERHGWAVGHQGVVIATADGGETWALQRNDTAVDRPLFSVHAFSAQHLVAVGLWSLVLRSSDGGASWQTAQLPPPPAAAGRPPRKADLNLFHLFTDERGRLYAAAERGHLLRSEDQGASWTYLVTGYAGSFWTGLAPAPGVLLAAGLRGSMYRSTDDGATWARIDTGRTASITALLAEPGRPGVAGRITALGLDGLLLHSTDQGASFSGSPRPDRAALTTGLAVPGGAPLLFSRQGAVAPEAAR